MSERPTARPSRVARIVDWCFRDRRSGAITIAQWPNASLLLFGLLTLAAWLFQPQGDAGTLLRAGAVAALAWWALDELIRGVNPWRRLLGAGVLAYQAIGLLWPLVAH